MWHWFRIYYRTKEGRITSGIFPGWTENSAIDVFRHNCPGAEYLDSEEIFS